MVFGVFLRIALFQIILFSQIVVFASNMSRSDLGSGSEIDSSEKSNDVKKDSDVTIDKSEVRNTSGEGAGGKGQNINQNKRVLIYRTAGCVDCDGVENELDKRNIHYQDVDLSWNRKQKMILNRSTGKEDVSYVFIGNDYVGNHNDLKKMIAKDNLRKIFDND